TLQQLISDTMVRWAQESVIEDPELVRAMFVLLHRQYDGIGGLVRALPKTYTINSVSVEDTINLLASLGQIRSLLSVRMGKEEEKLMIRGLGCLHVLQTPPFNCTECSWCCLHEEVVNTGFLIILLIIVKYILIRSTLGENCKENMIFSMSKESGFPSYFVQRNITICGMSASPSMRGSTPLDVAAASVMDNNELALALREPDLEKVVRYLAGCGLQSCPLLISKGYPDIGWNPVEGERYLDFLRFAVFCNGESVEENANVVVRLLIR
ncbi:Ryanodine receptor 2, partial [Eurypyga helias]